MWKLCSEYLLREYNSHLGSEVDYTGKTILDIGADVGTTTEYFLEHGAKFVYAVEGNENNHNTLHVNIRTHFSDRAICLPRIWIEKTEDFIQLISLWDKCDIVKVDIEGAEVHLLHVPDYIFNIVPEYVIEFHSETIGKLLKQKLLQNGYIIRGEGICDVLYAKRGDK